MIPITPVTDSNFRLVLQFPILSETVSEQVETVV